MLQCYYCGIILDKTNQTVEHIPAKNLFSEYPEEYKKNRLTVPACNSCNNQFSKIDQEIRDAIAVISDNNAQPDELIAKAIRSIMRPNNWQERVIINDNEVDGVEFNYNNLRQLHIKNFKGIFYAKYGHPIPDDFEIEVIRVDGKSDPNLIFIGEQISKYVNLNLDWSVSGHEDIFRYKIKNMTSNNGNLEDLDDISNASGFAAILEYHKAVTVTVIAKRKNT